MSLLGRRALLSCPCVAGVLLGSGAMALGAASDPQWTSTQVNAWAQSSGGSPAGASVYNSYDSGYVGSATSGAQSAYSPESLSGVVPSPIAPEGYDIPVTWTGEATSNATASAGPGSMHAYAYAETKLDPFTVANEQTDSNGNTFTTTVANPLTATASAEGWVQVKDTISFTSATLSPTDLVSFVLTLKTEGSTSMYGQQPTVFNSKMNSQTYYTMGYYQSTPLNLSGPGTISQQITVQLGRTLSLFASLDAYVGVDSGTDANKVALTTALVNASDTSSLYIDPLTDDFTVVSLSGHDYATPVPEPASLGLLALGGLLLGRRRH